MPGARNLGDDAGLLASLGLPLSTHFEDALGEGLTTNPCGSALPPFESSVGYMIGAGIFRPMGSVHSGVIYAFTSHTAPVMCTRLSGPTYERDCLSLRRIAAKRYVLEEYRSVIEMTVGKQAQEKGVRSSFHTLTHERYQASGLPEGCSSRN